ncbi:hypothetical protein [Amycolatopsis sp. NPDC059021]|uniref:hypothetical protein n=1 Tax=Amycolatopsis sp. NPDC059021 TaxID=3346704 RepID=UPI00366DFAAA
MTQTGGSPEPEGAETPKQGIPAQPEAATPESSAPEGTPVPGAGPPPGPPQTEWQAPGGTPGQPAASTRESPESPAPGTTSGPEGTSAPGAGPPPGPPQTQWQAPGGPPPPQPPPGYPGYPQQAQWNPHGLGKPGVIALRPLNLGDILDGSITTIRRYPLMILGISAVVAVITSALQLLVSSLVLPDLEQVARLGPGATEQELRNAAFGLLGDALLTLLPTLVITLLGHTFLSGFLTEVAGKAVLGRPVDFKTSMRAVAPRLLPLLGLTVLYTLATIVAAAFCLLPAVIPYIFWALASPALILERGTVRQAFSRSVKLVSGSFWRVLGILLLAALIGWMISSIIQVPFNIGSGVFSQLTNPGKVVVPSTGDLLLSSVGSVIVQTVVAPFTSLVTVLVYIDQRMRREGMDIELARAAGMTPPR